ncbi:MAG: iron complex outermembrane receptor protein [Pseudohongiellaceae bacterium]|jgi:iron complex outermembrane receptor protein
MNTKTLLSTAIIGANISGGLLFSPLLSAEAGLQLEEVVVSARKRLELEQDVPISTTIFSEAMIERAGIERPQDFISLTSNVSIVDSANAGDTQVTIRGITSTRDAEGTFAFVLDGVLITNPNGFNQELFDIQSIEVLKGPQGALYGRNAVAGAILINTKEPTSEFTGSIKAGAGSNGLEKIGVSVSGPLSDSARASLSISTRDDEGEFTNEFTGKDGEVDFLEEDNIRGRVIWDVSDRLTLDATASYREVSAGAINFNAVFALPTAAANFASPDLYKDVNDHDFRFMFNVPGENEQENTFFSLKADYDLDWATLTAVFAYDDLEEYLLSDGTSAAYGLYSFDFGAAAGPGSPLTGPAVGDAQNACAQTYNENIGILNEEAPFYAIPGAVPGMAADFGIAPFYGLNALLPPYTPTSCDGYQYQERNQESTSLEVRIASESDGNLNWMAGFYLAQIERGVVVSYGADFGDGFFGRQAYVPGRTDLLFSDKFETDVMAVFASLNYDVNDEHTVSLAARYDEESREVSNKVPNVLSSNAFGGGGPINPAYDGTLTDTISDRDADFSQFQPKLTWRWALMDEASVYASYGVGFRSGGFNNLGSQDLVEAQFGTFGTQPQNLRDEYDKEVSTSYELGMKSEWWDKRLRVNGALFHTEVEDSQFFNFLAGGFGILRVVTNIDEVTLQGAEIDFQAVLTQDLTVYGALGVVESKIDKNKNRPYTKGNDAPLTPEMTGNLGVQWVKPVMEGVELVARLDWQYVGKTWFSTVQSDTTVNGFTDVSALYQGIGAAFGDVTQVPAGPGLPAGGIIGFGESTYDKGQRDAYDTFNLRLSLEAASWTLTAWGDNITDEKYLEEIIPAPEFGGYFVHPAKGDAYGVDFIYRF